MEVGAVRSTCDFAALVRSMACSLKNTVFTALAVSASYVCLMSGASTRRPIRERAMQMRKYAILARFKSVHLLNRTAASSPHYSSRQANIVQAMATSQEPAHAPSAEPSLEPLYTRSTSPSTEWPLRCSEQLTLVRSATAKIKTFKTNIKAAKAKAKLSDNPRPLLALLKRVGVFLEAPSPLYEDAYKEVWEGRWHGHLQWSETKEGIRAGFEVCTLLEALGECRKKAVGLVKVVAKAKAEMEERW